MKTITNTLSVQGNEQTTTVQVNEQTATVQVNEQKKNPVRLFFTAVNKKRKQLIAAAVATYTMAVMSAVTAFAEGEGGGGVTDGEGAFNEVINFFATWIGRIGLVVAFVGGIMFALAIKNDDADAKTRGLMTMASGFVVFALTLSLDLFGITG